MSDIKINYVIGDATDPQGEGHKFICHCCNNDGKWGRGFVVSLSRRWSTPELMYRRWAQERPQELKEGLGKIQVIPVEKDVWVINIVGQEGIQTNNDGIPPIRYDAIREGLEKAQTFMQDKKNPSIHFPRIGCGLAGGSWCEIEEIIKDTINVPITVYTLPHEAEKFGMKIKKDELGNIPKRKQDEKEDSTS